MIFSQNNNLTKEEKCKYESDEHYRCRNFFGVIDQCKEKVELVTENGDRYNLKCNTCCRTYHAQSFRYR